MVPFRWVTRIESWQPPYRFVDVQERGPYALWHHTHEFVARDGGTRIRDTVRYVMPFGILGELAHRLFVGRELSGIFDFRARKLSELLVREGESLLAAPTKTMG